MKRALKPLLCVLFLVSAASAHAQEHQHQHTDTTRATPTEHGDMMHVEHMQAMMPQIMAMHERMMADSVIHQRMMADPEMHQMMGDDMDMDAMREHMAEMPPDERHQMMQQMHARMMERMETMPTEERQAMMHRMMEAHRRLTADPAVRERMMADPEMREMMEEMHDGGMMDHDGMQHDRMDGMQHGEMDHGGMNHDRMVPAPMSAGDARAAEAASRTVDRFHAALAAGDRAAVEALLLREAIVLEGGQAETRGEYLGHHFQRDATFLAAVERDAITDAYRRHAAAARRLEQYALEQPDSALPASDEAALCACFEGLLPTLKPEYAELIEAMDLGGATAEEMTGRLDVTRNNLKVRHHRARQQLRERLEETCRTCAEHGCVDCTCSQ